MKIWTTKEGEKIKVCNLKDDHLLNIIKMLERNHNFEIRHLSYPSFGGEMAQDWAEHEYYRIIQYEPVALYPIYDALHKEVADRGLKL